MGIWQCTLHLFFNFIMFILWHQYDNIGIVFTGGFSFTFKFWQTQISAHNIIVTHIFVKNILHQCLSIWHREWLNTGVRSNQNKNQFSKWRSNTFFHFLNKIFPRFFIHSKEKDFPLNITKTTKKCISMKKIFYLLLLYYSEGKLQKRFFQAAKKYLGTPYLGRKHLQCCKKNIGFYLSPIHLHDLTCKEGEC